MSRSSHPDNQAIAFRALQDAWLEGSRLYWLRRARDFEWVITGDRTTPPTDEQLAANPGVAETITACRSRAAFAAAARAEFTDTLTDTLTDLAAGDAA